ncbi:MAG: signal peptidase II [Pirellulales bacterium]
MTNQVRLRWLGGLALLVACVGCDQATKRLATQTLRNTPARSYLADTVRLEYALNPGGFLSLGANLPPTVRRGVFIAFNAGLLLGFAALLGLRRDLSAAWFLAVLGLLAGGIGNLIDRVSHDGLVIDFINLGVGPVRTGIFNVADVAITGGGLALLALSWRRSGQPTSPISAPQP